MVTDQIRPLIAVGMAIPNHHTILIYSLPDFTLPQLLKSQLGRSLTHRITERTSGGGLVYPTAPSRIS